MRARTGAFARTAYLLTGDRRHAEELVQTALTAAAERWTRLDDPERYVRRVLYARAISRWRRLRRRAQSPVGPPAERGAALARALAGLRPRQRAALVLRFHEDCSESEAAEILGVGLAALRDLTGAAVRRLHEVAPDLTSDLTGETEEHEGVLS
ncbi:RNA polymerase sigma24 factor [Virgisporangium aliadipatigenens]|uniref:RNA polymerase sigma24 factor n=1 Tax=Virgisporangium aliadipatigenens TaxID=741659 RepID=A0A8J3YM43_9ACTN|nr:RNA polymerase sigma24 factor [Virgisporangium aliadipatigenens]